MQEEVAVLKRRRRALQARANSDVEDRDCLTVLVVRDVIMQQTSDG